MAAWIPASHYAARRNPVAALVLAANPDMAGAMLGSAYAHNRYERESADNASIRALYGNDAAEIDSAQRVTAVGLEIGTTFAPGGAMLRGGRLGRSAATVDDIAINRATLEAFSPSGAAPGVAGRGYSGGAYGRLSAQRGVIERRHAPANSVSPYTTYSGPAIQMDHADHLLTASHGSQGLAGALYRSEIRQLIDSGNMRGAMAREIWDIRRVSVQSSGSTTKYNAATREMLDYAYSLGHLNKVP